MEEVSLEEVKTTQPIERAHEDENQPEQTQNEVLNKQKNNYDDNFGQQQNIDEQETTDDASE